MSRPVAWFSRGAASAVMTKLAIAEYGDDLVVACIGELLAVVRVARGACGFGRGPMTPVEFGAALAAMVRGVDA